MTMKTPRNNLTATLMPTDTEMLEEIDAVYEILDAELNSDKSVYDRATYILKHESKPQESLAQLFQPFVERVSKRDGLMLGVPVENHVEIARQLASDWDNSKGLDIRREKKTVDDSPSP